MTLSHRRLSCHYCAVGKFCFRFEDRIIGRRRCHDAGRERIGSLGVYTSSVQLFHHRYTKTIQSGIRRGHTRTIHIQDSDEQHGKNVMGVARITNSPVVSPRGTFHMSGIDEQRRIMRGAVTLSLSGGVQKILWRAEPGVLDTPSVSALCVGENGSPSFSREKSSTSGIVSPISRALSITGVKLVGRGGSAMRCPTYMRDLARM